MGELRRGGRRCAPAVTVRGDEVSTAVMVRGRGAAPNGPNAHKIILDGTETSGRRAGKSERRHKVPDQSLIIGRSLC